MCVSVCVCVHVCVSVCMHACICMCVIAHTQRSEDKFLGKGCYFLSVDLRKGLSGFSCSTT